MFKWLMTVAALLLGFSQSAQACDNAVVLQRVGCGGSRFLIAEPVVAVRERVVLAPAVVRFAPATSVTTLRFGLFGRLRSFQQVEAGAGFRGGAGAGATSIRFGPFGRVRSFQQVR